MEKVPFLTKISSSLKALILCALVFNIFATPVVEAQGVAGFSACQFTEGSNSPDDIGNCIRQVLQFALIVGIFVALFRIGYVAFQSSNPFAGGGTTADMVKALRDFGIGILILGGPVIVLNTINPALLNFDFLSGIANLNGSGNNSSNSGNSNNSGNSTISGSNASVDGTKPSDLQSAVETLQSDPANQQAQNTVKKILEAQRECSSLFVTDFNKCKSIEDPGFQEALNQVPQSLQETLGGGFAPQTNFSGNFVPTQDFFVDPSGASNVQKNNQGCDVFSIQIAPTQGNGSSTLQVTKCNKTKTSDLFKTGPNGDLVINSGTTIKAGTVINEPSAAYNP